MSLDQLPDLTDWRHVEVWTLEEAAMLWAAIDPMEHVDKRLEDLKLRVPSMQFRKAMIFLRAAKEAVCAGTLSFTEAWEDYEDDSGNCWSTKIEFPKLPEPRHIAPEMTRVQQAAFMKWAQSKNIPSYRQSLSKARKIQKPSTLSSNVVDVVEAAQVKQSEAVLLLEKPSPLDTNHPHHAEEVGFAAQAWEIAVEIGAPLPGKTVKQTLRHILNTHPQFSNLSNDARERLSKSANWERKGGVSKTPSSEEPTHFQ